LTRRALALFLAPSADLEYLTGVARQIPNFGGISYQHGWITGALFRQSREPVFLLPRMFAAFDLHEEPAGEVIDRPGPLRPADRGRHRRRRGRGRKLNSYPTALVAKS
jgi:hypothetical protein